MAAVGARDRAPAAPSGAISRAVVESEPIKKTYELTDQEWEAMAGVPEVYEGFELEDEAEPAKWLKENTYAVRFEHEAGGLGYVGPLYLLQGAGAPEIPPITMVRKNGGLRAVATW